MARANSDQQLQPSILNRLTDPETGNVSRQGYSLAKMEQAVLKDLENLLNTPQPYYPEQIPEAFDQVRTSLVTYGLPNPGALRALTDAQKADLVSKLRFAVESFEPRLRLNDVEILTSEEDQERNLRIRFKACLDVDPAPELPFDTILDLTTGRYSVKASSS